MTFRFLLAAATAALAVACAPEDAETADAPSAVADHDMSGHDMTGHEMAAGHDMGAAPASDVDPGVDPDAAPEITVVDAWVRAPLAGRDVTSAYFTVRNAGGADRLVAARCDCAETTELHTHVHGEGGVMRMEPVEAYDAPAGGAHALAPGGDHLMLFGVAPDLGDAATLTLTFERAGEVTVEAEVRALGE